MKEKKTNAGRKIVSLLLVVAMLFTMQGTPVLAETVSNGQKQGGAASGSGGAAALMPKNPVHHCTKKNDGTDTTDWSYVYFGSYPQTEVTGDALTAAITGASYDSNGDAWVGSTKYRRISKSDTNYDGYFGYSTYRYFKWERIKWRVLKNDGSTLFVAADKGLDCKDYNEEYYLTWENCTLRSWLNSEFYGTAFSSGEQGAIVRQNIVNEDNPYYGTEGGNDTSDNVFLLSIGEVTNPAYGFCEDYSTYSASRWMQASDYAHARGADIYSSTGGNANCWWWLRSPGVTAYYAASVYDYGNVYRYGSIVDSAYGACVPALHINLSSDLWSMADDGTSGEGGNGGAGIDPNPVPIDSTIQCRSSLVISEGETEKVAVMAYGDDLMQLEKALSPVKWKSENPSVATVSGGAFYKNAIEQQRGTGEHESYMVWTNMAHIKITGKSIGTTTITGTAADGSVCQCKITVEENVEKSRGTSGSGGSLTIGEDASGAAPGVADFFPDSWNFKGTVFPVEISKEEEQDGSYKIKGSIGIGRGDLLDNESEWNKYKKTIDEVNKILDKGNRLGDLMEAYDARSGSFMDVSKFKKVPKLSMLGYFENKYDKNGKLISTTGKIAANVTWKGSISWQFATPIGPLYLNLEGSGEVSCTVGPLYDIQKKEVKLVDGSLSLKPSITLEGGYGVNKVATIGTQGNASFPVTVLPNWKGELNASASVHLYVALIIDKPWTLATYKKVFWDSSAKKSVQGVDSVGELFPDGTLSAIDTSFTTYESDWNGAMSDSDTTIDATGSTEDVPVQDAMLMDGILPSSLPMQAEINGKHVMVFQSYDSARNTLDSSVLNYSVYENGIWSEPKPVWDNGCSDMFADMKVVNNRLVLAWQKAKAKVSRDIDQDGEGVLEEIAKNSEICFAVFDEASGTFTNQTYVTDNNACDTMPRICNGSNDIILSWIRNDAADLMQETGSNTIYTSAWNGDSFETEEKLIQSFGTIEEFITYQDDTDVKAVYASIIGEGEEKANVILNEENQAMESLPELVSDASAGTVSEMRYENGNIDFLLNGTLYRYHTSDGTIESFLAGESAFGNTAKYCSNGEKSGYIWSLYNEETDTDSIIASMASENGYCEPVTLYEKKGVIWRYISPILKEDGSWAFLANAMQTTEGQENHNSLIYVEKQPESGVALAGAFVNMYDTKDGMTGIDYYVQNTGDSPIHELCLDITMADGTIRTQKIPITLWPGESAAETAYIDLSDVDSSQDISIAVYEKDQNGKEDCVTTATVGQADIEVSGIAEDSGDTVKITAELKNNSQIQADTTLSLYSDETCTKELYPSQKETITADGSKKIQMQVSKKDITYNENDAAYLTLKASVQGGDYNEDNNVSYIILYNPKSGGANKPEEGGNNAGGTQNPGNQTAKTSLANSKATLSKTSYTYNGKEKKPGVTVKFGSATLANNRDYKLTYKNNKKVGTASVTITGTGNYTGSLIKTFKIIPKGTSISGKIQAKSKGFTVKWKKQKSVTGYQIQYSTSRKFTKKTTIVKTVKMKSAAKLSVGKLKANKKYYVRIRTYQTVKGKKYASAWSKAKTVKTKGSAK